MLMVHFVKMNHQLQLLGVALDFGNDECHYILHQSHPGGVGSGTTRPLSRDGGAEELHRDQIVGPHPKVWTIGQE